MEGSRNELSKQSRQAASARGELEAWLEQQLVRYHAQAASTARPSPERFAELAADEPGAPDPRELSRARLLARLRLVAAIEEALGEPPGGASAESAALDLDGFELLERIGQGGMGLVFRAREKALGREVAIKVPRFGAELGPRERARFGREAQAVAQLRHPGIVALYQVGLREDQPFLVMEHVTGRSLAAILRELRTGAAPREAASLGRSGPSYERAATELTVEILEAVEAAHREGIVHRDLKPANVLVEPTGRARIVDFGLARFERGEALTHSGELLGTPDYIAPEVLRNPRAASPASDCYAVGVLLYELVALARPFGEHTPEVVMARALAGEAPPLASRRRVPLALSAVVERAMAADSGARYASAGDFAADLGAFLEGRDVTARPSTALTRLGRRMARRPALSALGALTLLLGCILSVVWMNAREFKLAAHRRAAQDLVRTALFLDQADSSAGGGVPERSAGRSQAVGMLEQALHLHASLDEAQLHRAVMLYELGRPAECLSVLQELDEFGRVHAVVGWLCAVAKHDQTRFFHFRGTLPENATAPDLFYWARSQLVSLHTEVGDRRERKQADVRSALTALQSHPLYGPAAHYFLGVSWMTGPDADHGRASGYLRAAHALSPVHPIATANFATMLHRSFEVRRRAGVAEAPSKSIDLQEAMALLKSALERAPEYEILWVNYAAIFAESFRDGAQAAEICRQGLKHHPTSANLHFFLGQIFKDEMFALGDLETPSARVKGAEARVHLERAVELDPRDSMKRIQLANLYYLLDEPEPTVMCVNAALELGLPEAHHGLAQTMLEWARTELEGPASAPASQIDRAGEG